ncbi:MAG: thioredoxin fold domain-containing protein [Rhodocyclaceae bacterium]|nr:thioredoxin fold domain-containing protein [Rhodocyclaceae bacterium]
MMNQNLAALRKAATIFTAALVLNVAAAGSAVAKQTADDRARTLDNIVLADGYSMKVSSGSKDTVYIFSDPACGYCRRLEKNFIEKYAKDYTIYILPVTIIGGSESMRAVSEMLCDAPENRLTMWKQFIQGTAQLRGNDCKAGRKAATHNNKMLNNMGFTSVPTIINSVGENVPKNMLGDVSKIVRWLESFDE